MSVAPQVDFKIKDRRYVFTVNNPVVPNPWAELPAGVSYMVWQHEKGDEGTNHLQGYIRFKNAVQRKTVERILGGHAWINIAKGTEQQNYDYCTKQESRVSGPYELGTRTNPLGNQGARKDLDPFKEAVKTVYAGGSMYTLDPMVIAKHYKALQAVQHYTLPPRRDDLQVICIEGVSGIGKTHWIYDHFPIVYRPSYGNNGLWWDGYQGEDVILLDEFKGQCPLQRLLQILDKYPLQLEVKASFTPARFTKIFITCNTGPAKWYPNKAEAGRDEYAALLRRLGVDGNNPNSHYIIATTRVNLQEQLNRLKLCPDEFDPSVVAPPCQHVPDDQSDTTPSIPDDDDSDCQVLPSPPRIRRCNATITDSDPLKLQ